jgi:hypothetical protein
MVLATFWVIFSPPHLVTLISSLEVVNQQKIKKNVFVMQCKYKKIQLFKTTDLLFKFYIPP